VLSDLSLLHEPTNAWEWVKKKKKRVVDGGRKEKRKEEDQWVGKSWEKWNREMEEENREKGEYLGNHSSY